MAKSNLLGLKKTPPVRKQLPSDEGGVEVIGKKTPQVMLPGERPAYRPGDIVMTRQEKQDLELVGYKDGDAIPGDLAEIISTARGEMAQDYSDAIENVKLHGKKVEPPQKPVDISKLSPQKRQELERAMQKAQHDIKVYESLQEQKAAMGGIDPSLAQAAQMASGSPGIKVFRSPKKEYAKPQETKQPKPPPILDTNPHQEPDDTLGTWSPPEMGGPVGAEEQPASFMMGTGVHLTNCPHCNWQLDQPEKAEPSKDDIFNYGTAMIGGKEFLKEMLFFGGRLRVVYRNPSQSHIELITTQLSIDRRSGRLTTNLEDFWRLLWSYRLAVSLYSITFDTESYELASRVDDAIAGASPTNGAMDTVIPAIVEELMTIAPLKSESIWRILNTNVIRFKDLVEFLEAHADDESFYQAIVG